VSNQNRIQHVPAGFRPGLLGPGRPDQVHSHRSRNRRSVFPRRSLGPAGRRSATPYTRPRGRDILPSRGGFDPLGGRPDAIRIARGIVLISLAASCLRPKDAHDPRHDACFGSWTDHPSARLFQPDCAWSIRHENTPQEIRPSRMVNTSRRPFCC